MHVRVSELQALQTGLRWKMAAAVLQVLKWMKFSETHQPMKVKAKYLQSHLIIICFGICPWYLAAPWIFDILFGSWDIRKSPRTLPSQKIEPKHVSRNLWINHWANFIQILNFDRNL